MAVLCNLTAHILNLYQYHLHTSLLPVQQTRSFPFLTDMPARSPVNSLLTPKGNSGVRTAFFKGYFKFVRYTPSADPP